MWLSYGPMQVVNIYDFEEEYRGVGHEPLPELQLLGGRCPFTSGSMLQWEVAVRLKRASAISVILVHIRPRPSSSRPCFRVIHCPHQRELGKDIPL